MPNDPRTPEQPSATIVTATVTSVTYEAGLAAAPGEVASFERDDTSLLRRLRGFLHANPTAIPVIVLLISIAVFGTLVGHRFFDPFDFSLILQQVMIIGVIGIAQTLIITTAGIDLSVGAIMVLSSVVMGRLAIDNHVPVALALAAGLAVGAACGLVNGLIIALVRLPPFIATLGTLNIFFALNLWYSNSETIRSEDIEAKAPALQWFGHAIDVHGARLTYGSIFMIALFVLFAYLLSSTAWGRHVYATGDDEEAARLAGISPRRIYLSVYTLAGFICALGGWVLIGRIGSVSPQSGQTANLDSITAVVIGGTSLFGGRGAIIGTLIGALIVGVFRNGLALAGVDVLWQELAVGVLIIVAVAIDQWLRRIAQ
ncbi:MAG: ABC transporter permease [Rhodospirillales bacterium]|nr:ABC transporter permease [Rhodospirillales bacterium]MDE2198815.1 ABC transporter permease [Rhodospirillales bacterium]MDE2575581.1 ABC transporter permease [Rhodospirillales bacterium]